MGGSAEQGMEAEADTGVDAVELPFNTTNASAGLTTAASTTVKESVSAQPDHGRALLASAPSSQQTAFDHRRSRFQKKAEATPIPA